MHVQVGGIKVRHDDVGSLLDSLFVGGSRLGCECGRDLREYGSKYDGGAQIVERVCWVLGQVYAVLIRSQVFQRLRQIQTGVVEGRFVSYCLKWARLGLFVAKIIA